MTEELSEEEKERQHKILQEKMRQAGEEGVRADEENEPPSFTEKQLAQIHEYLNKMQPALDALVESVRIDLETGKLKALSELDDDDLIIRFSKVTNEFAPQFKAYKDALGIQEFVNLQSLLSKYSKQDGEHLTKSPNPGRKLLTERLHFFVQSGTPEPEDIKSYLAQSLESEK